jgi:DNA helicase-2/ATP-dependent DNA helicase PcrA
LRSERQTGLKGKEMDDILEGLDDEQRAVVAHREGPAIVIAGPGSGKTRTITTRAAALLRDGVSPEAIMMITFTRAAAKEMVRRSAALDPRAAYMTAGTFHAVGSRIVQANHRLLGSDREFTVLDGDDTEQLLKRNIDQVRSGAKNWPRASTVAKVISFAANTGIGIEAALRQRAPDYEHLADEITEIAQRHAIYKLDHGLLSYDDILSMWAALLEDQEIGDELRSRWRYIMLDEQQDANWLQQSVVQGLAGPGGNVLAVGDASQAIYGFRGSSPSVLKELHRLHPEAAIYTISSNYRSTEAIVALGAAIDATMDTGFRRNLKAMTGRVGVKPEIVDVHDAATEASVIADAILEDKAQGGELSDHAVLVRSTAAARRIEAEFISRHIPFVVQGGTRIDEAAHIRDLLSVARLAGNLSHEPAWLRLLTRFPRIGDKAAGDIAAIVMQAPSVGEATRVLEMEGAARKTGLATLGDALTAAASDGAPADRLERIIAEMSPVWKEVWSDDWKNRARDLDAVIMIAQEHATMSDFLTAITLDGSLDREGIVPSDKPDELPVTISTVHGAKGLEYRKVHIPSFVQGGMPSMFANGDDEREEEKRIAFVAVTRAKDTLTFYRPRFNGQGNFTMMSDYEPIIARHVTQRQHVRKSAAGDARIETTKRIDMRSRILGGVKK